jgi:MFS family permease
VRRKYLKARRKKGRRTALAITRIGLFRAVRDHRGDVPELFDQTVFGMLAQRIKIDFGLTDEQLGFLGGPASVIFFVFVGIPLARLADIYPRKLVLAGGMAATGVIMGLGGIAQGFGQFIGSRMFLGAGGSAHAPAAYSMIADYFPRRRSPAPSRCCSWASSAGRPRACWPAAS